MNWNPWVAGRLTVPKTLGKVYKVKNKNIMVDPEIDFFSYDLDSKWRTKALLIMTQNPQNNYFIPTKYPGNILYDFLKPHIWVGVKLNKNNQLALLSYDNIMPKNEKRWLYLKNYRDPIYNSELFSCTGKEHLSKGYFWKYAYPCSTCDGMGIINKYKLNWIVLSGHKSGVRREVVDDFRINCDNTGIPFYYEKAWIGNKLIRDPQLYGRPCVGKPKQIFD